MLFWISYLMSLSLFGSSLCPAVHAAAVGGSIKRSNKDWGSKYTWWQKMEYGGTAKSVAKAWIINISTYGCGDEGWVRKSTTESETPNI